MSNHIDNNAPLPPSKHTPGATDELPPNNNQSLIDDALALIKFLKERPDFPVCNPSWPLTLNHYVFTKEALVDFVRQMGHATKRDSENYFHFDRDFGKHFRISVFTDRSKVCRKVTRMEEVTTWECPESVLADVPRELEEKVE